MRGTPINIIGPNARVGGEETSTDISQKSRHVSKTLCRRGHCSVKRSAEAAAPSTPHGTRPPVRWAGGLGWKCPPHTPPPEPGLAGLPFHRPGVTPCCCRFGGGGGHWSSLWMRVAGTTTTTTPRDKHRASGGLFRRPPTRAASSDSR